MHYVDATIYIYHSDGLLDFISSNLMGGGHRLPAHLRALRAPGGECCGAGAGGRTGLLPGGAREARDMDFSM